MFLTGQCRNRSPPSRLTGSGYKPEPVSIVAKREAVASRSRLDFLGRLGGRTHTLNPQPTEVHTLYVVAVELNDR